MLLLPHDVHTTHKTCEFKPIEEISWAWGDWYHTCALLDDSRNVNKASHKHNWPHKSFDEFPEQSEKTNLFEVLELKQQKWNDVNGEVDLGQLFANM